MSVWAFSIGTAIGWIVDLTTLGATIIYGLVSYAVFKDARRRAQRLEQTTGISGLVLMLAFGLMLLLPNIFSFGAMASESYILFDLWALIGLLYFRRLIYKDKNRRYGHSVLVWVILLLLVLFASTMWVTKQTQIVTNGTMMNIHEYYQTESAANDAEFLRSQSDRINISNTWFTIASYTVFVVSAVIILNNYQVMRKREQEHSEQLSIAEKKATTDQLTGIKNRRAYACKTEKIQTSRH